MNHSTELDAEINRLELVIDNYHTDEAIFLGVDSSQIIRALPEAEQIDWSAVASAGVEYKRPIGDEVPEELAKAYLRALDTYVERWIYPKKAEPQYISAKRIPWWKRIQVVWYNMGSFSIPYLTLKK